MSSMLWALCYPDYRQRYLDFVSEQQSGSDYGSTEKPSTVADPWGDSGTSTASGESETTQPTVNSSKTNPDHYRRGAIEPWDFIASQGMDFLLGNAVKYITRAGHKPGESAKDDLEKAIVYLQKKLSTL
jgi:hypothetical protein